MNKSIPITSDDIFFYKKFTNDLSKLLSILDEISDLKNYIPYNKN